MTTDPAIQSLFKASTQQYDDEAFTQEVMKKSRFIRFKLRIILGAAFAFAAILITLNSTEAQSGIIALNAIMSADIFELEEGLAAIFLEPINTIAGLLIILAKLGHLLFKWIKK